MTELLTPSEDYHSKEPSVNNHKIKEFVETGLRSKPYFNPPDPAIIDYLVDIITTKLNNGNGNCNDLEKLLEESIRVFINDFNEAIKAN